MLFLKKSKHSSSFALINCKISEYFVHFDNFLQQLFNEKALQRPGTWCKIMHVKGFASSYVRIGCSHGR